jgi:CRISPR system Cascade subunit CasA
MAWDDPVGADKFVSIPKVFPTPVGLGVALTDDVPAERREADVDNQQAKYPSFNIVTRPWIHTIGLDGSFREVSIRELFETAPDIREVTGDIPQQILPILRLLLAILYAAYGKVYDTSESSRGELRRLWTELMSRKRFDMETIGSYLDENIDGFDLFGSKPFFQVAGLQYSSKSKEFDPIAEAIPDVPKPDKFLFSMRSRESLGGISFAEAARQLVFMQAYDCAGIKTPVVGNTHAKNGKAYPPKGIPGTGWMGSIGGVFIEGENLFQTLMFNWALYDKRGSDNCLLGIEGDCPSWESNSSVIDSAECIPAGPASLFTCQCRRLRLIPDEDDARVVGIVCCYGDIVSPVRMLGKETMTSWRESPQQQKKCQSGSPVYMPKTHDCKKALWRELTPLLSYVERPDDYRPGVIDWLEEICDEKGVAIPPSIVLHAQGMSYGTQSSVFVDAFDDRVTMSSALVHHDDPALRGMLGVIDAVDKAVFRLSVFVRNVEELGGDKRAKNQSVATSDDVKARAYAELDQMFRECIASFSPEKDADEYCLAWKAGVRRRLIALADGYLASSGTTPFARHKKGSVAEAKSRFIKELDVILG